MLSGYTGFLCNGGFVRSSVAKYILCEFCPHSDTLKNLYLSLPPLTVKMLLGVAIDAQGSRVA